MSVPERRERRRQNEILIIAIRKLVRLVRSQAFLLAWEGALGNASYRHLNADSLQLALNKKTYSFCKFRMNLLDAMHTRDLSELAAILMRINDKKLDMFHGVHVKYGKRLVLHTESTKGVTEFKWSNRRPEPWNC